MPLAFRCAWGRPPLGRKETRVKQQKTPEKTRAPGGPRPWACTRPQRRSPLASLISWKGHRGAHPNRADWAPPATEYPAEARVLRPRRAADRPGARLAAASPRACSAAEPARSGRAGKERRLAVVPSTGLARGSCRAGCIRGQSPCPAQGRLRISFSSCCRLLERDSRRGPFFRRRGANDGPTRNGRRPQSGFSRGRGNPNGTLPEPSGHPDSSVRSRNRCVCSAVMSSASPIC